MKTLTLPESTLVKSQVQVLEKVFFQKDYEGRNQHFRIRVKLRYDDERGNGHNTFAITGDVDRQHPTQPNRWIEESGGCIHDEIEKHFPELRPLIKWHLTSTDGPMHYIPNTLYLAGNRDCHGKLKGEPASFKTSIFFDNVPIPFDKYSECFSKWLQIVVLEGCPLTIVEVAHKNTNYRFGPKYTLARDMSATHQGVSVGKGLSEWYQCPFDSKDEAQSFLKALHTCEIKFVKTCVSYGEGKERELNLARSSAVWPDATDEELCSEDLEQKLIDRLPALMAEFKREMENLGFKY